MSEEDSDIMDTETHSTTSSEAVKAMEEFEELQLQHDVSFSSQKRLGCFSHTLQLVIKKFDTVQLTKKA